MAKLIPKLVLLATMLIGLTIASVRAFATPGGSHHGCQYDATQGVCINKGCKTGCVLSSLTTCACVP
jgi:hypothetical protein